MVALDERDRPSRLKEASQDRESFGRASQMLENEADKDVVE